MVFVSQIECAALGRIYLSPVDELPSHMSPPRPRAMRRHSASPYSLPTLQQTHTEVWVATCEASVAYIEIVDVLSKVHNRFSLTVSMLLYVTMTICRTVICYNIKPRLLQLYHVCLNMKYACRVRKEWLKNSCFGATVLQGTLYSVDPRTRDWGPGTRDPETRGRETWIGILHYVTWHLKFVVPLLIALLVGEKMLHVNNNY